MYSCTCVYVSVLLTTTTIHCIQYIVYTYTSKYWFNECLYTHIETFSSYYTYIQYIQTHTNTSLRRHRHFLYRNLKQFDVIKSLYIEREENRDDNNTQRNKIKI